MATPIKEHAVIETVKNYCRSTVEVRTAIDSATANEKIVKVKIS